MTAHFPGQAARFRCLRAEEDRCAVANSNRIQRKSAMRAGERAMAEFVEW